jgi:hypothetical protein
MNNTILEVKKGDFVYEVEYDDFPEIGKDFDFDTEKENEEYLKLFENEELFSYVVFKKEICKCCGASEKIAEVIGGFHAHSAEEALEQFLDHVG